MKSVSFGNSRGYMNTTLKNGECPALSYGKPDAGNPHVRFDEGGTRTAGSSTLLVKNILFWKFRNPKS